MTLCPSPTNHLGRIGRIGRLKCLVLPSVTLGIALSIPLATQGQEDEDAETQLSSAQTQQQIGARADAFGAGLDGIPIRMPSFHGIEPVVMLSHQLGGANGFLGVGWRLVGAALIERGQRARGAPKFDETDRFFLDGEELVPSTVLGGTHATRNQRYLRIQASDGQWTIVDKEGRQMIFKPLDAHGYRYGLDMVQDAVGRSVTYTWDCKGDEDTPDHCYPKTMSYSGVVVEFEQEDRSDAMSYATGKWLGKQEKRLKAITVTRGTERVRKYTLDYRQSPATGRSVLEAVQESGKLDEAQLPATRYELWPTSSGLSDPMPSPFYALGEKSLSPWNQLFLGDFNGDGRSDLLYHRNGGFFVRYGQASGALTDEDQPVGLGAKNQPVSKPALGQRVTCTPPRPNKCRSLFGSEFCTDFQTNAANCGSCGHDCRTAVPHRGDKCVQGKCQKCENSAQTECRDIRGNTFCTDLETDIANCGSCGHDCRTAVPHRGNKCVQGKCQECEDPSLTECRDIRGNEFCTDLETDIANCGSCGHDCRTAVPHRGNKCVQGKCQECEDPSLSQCRDIRGTEFCTDLQSDAGNCGSCGHNCGTAVPFKGKECVQGTCQFCKSDTETYCKIPPGAPGGGFSGVEYCADLSTDKHNCGECGEICPVGTNCSSGTCVDKDGQPVVQKPDDLFSWESFWIADINLDGKDDITYVASNGGTPYGLVTLLSTGTGFADPIVSNLPQDGTRPRNYKRATWLGDFTGDGVPDLVYVNHDLSYYQILRGQGDGLYADAERWADWADAAGTQFESIWPGDFDGDGRMDLLFLDSTGAHQVWLLRATETVAEKTLWAALPRQPEYSSGRFWAWASDYNGDGKTDLLILDNPLSNGGPVTARWKLYASVGYSGQEVSSTPFQELRDVNSVRVQDFNGDGRSDMLYVRFSAGGETCHSNCPTKKYMLMESTGEGGFGTPKEWADYQVVPSWASIRAADFNGDTRPDLLWVDKEEKSYHLQVNQTSYDLYQSSSNGYGAEIKFDYKASSEWQSRNSSSVFMTLSSVRTWDGRSVNENGQAQWSITDYEYGGAAYDYEERRFLGFHYVKTTDPCIGDEAACPYTESWYRQSRSSSGQLEQQRSCNGNGELMAAVVNEFFENNDNPPYVSFVTGTWTADYEGEYGCTVGALPQDGGKRRFIDRCEKRENGQCVKHTYDQNGNSLRQMNHGDVTRQGDELRTENHFVPNTTSHIVSLPAAQTIYGDIKGTKVLRHHRWRYDKNESFNQAPKEGLITGELEWIDESNAYALISRTYHPETHNVTEEIDPMGASTTYDYDTKYGEYVVGITNELGHHEERTWDYGCETIKTRTDINKETTEIIYDDLCRPKRMNRPLGVWQETKYCTPGEEGSNPCANASLRRVQVENSGPPQANGSPGTLITESFLDGLGRTWRIEQSGPTENQPIITQRSYDARGNIELEVGPYYKNEEDTKMVVRKAFDARNRPVGTTWASGVGQSLIYSLDKEDRSLTRIEAIDEEGHKTVEFQDVHGRTVARHLQDKDGTLVPHMRTDYDALGRVSQIEHDPLGKKILWTYRYDSLGRLIESEDPGRKKKSYHYDAAGRLRIEYGLGVHVESLLSVSTTDLKYDKLGRLTSTHTYLSEGSPEADEVTATYYYDGREPGNDVPSDDATTTGRLTLVVDDSGSSRWSYDVVGRPTRHVKNIEGTNYVFETGYTKEGLLLWRKFPNGEQVGSPDNTYTYDGAGRLKTIPGYVDSIEYGADGQIRVQKNANKTTSTRGYDPDRGWLDKLSTKNGQGQTLYETAYVRYDNGQIEKSDGWTYEYDPRQRLTKATPWEGSSLEAQVFEYDAVDNLVESPIGKYTYEPARPHAAVQAGPHRYRYNWAGDMIEKNNLRIRHNAQHLVVGVRNEGEDQDAHTYVYDYKGERVKKTSNNISTFHPSLDYEADATQSTLYINVRGELVAKRSLKLVESEGIKVCTAVRQEDGSIVSQCETKSATPKTVATNTWLHTDERGSLRSASDDTGARLFRRDYLPYGARHLVTSTPSGKKVARTDGPSAEKLEAHGFIGERNDEETGLMYLHARYYDPTMGRFVSPDPSHPLKEGVGLNPYAYSGNNPINRIDRNGLSSKKTNKTNRSTRTERGLRGLDREHGDLARNVYNAEGAPVGWTRVRNFPDDDSGFFAALYKRDKGGLFVLAFRGTEDGKDALTDVLQGVGLLTTRPESTQYETAIRVAKIAQYLAQSRGGRLRLTGHSLGGGLATAAALVTDQHAVVFNPAGVHKKTLERHETSFDRAGELITNYIVGGEILNTMQDFTPFLRHAMPSSVGRRIYLDRGHYANGRRRTIFSASGHGSQSYLDSPRTMIE